jgi:phosphopantothenate synthetase
MKAQGARRATVTESEAGVVLIPVSAGELIDKITILAIKTERVQNVQKRLVAARELALLQRAAAPLLGSETGPAAEIPALTARLAAVNAALWEIEDFLRAMERAQRFDARFVELARSVYRTNDERARLKNAISAAAGSSLSEVKEHPEY